MQTQTKCAIEKADVLIESLPYIKKFAGSTVVIKFGGSAMIDEKIMESVIQDIVLMKYVNLNPVIVHGGGTAISALLKQLNIQPVFIDGLRVTDEATMEVVEMVLAGKLNKKIVSMLNHKGARAIGLTGKDANLIFADKTKNKKLGAVGEIKKINPGILLSLIKDGFVPVIAPVTADKKMETLNLNADTVASAVASSISARKLVLLTDVDGLLNAKGKLISSISQNAFNKLKKSKTVKGGMIPKLSSAFNALKKGVKKVHIINGKIKHSLLVELFTDKGIGTEIILREGAK